MFTVSAIASRRIGGLLDRVIVNIYKAEIVACNQSFIKHCNAVDVCTVLARWLDPHTILAKFYALSRPGFLRTMFMTTPILTFAQNVKIVSIVVP